jgi:hypothetical protein
MQICLVSLPYNEKRELGRQLLQFSTKPPLYSSVSRASALKQVLWT